ncbi:MAG: addiction module protein [Thermodesulfobacteriota bacterium]|nr:addiction module protein [Thermodesulfobacteriota bacterium]
MDVKDIIESSKYLSAKERALIAHCMISSLETRQDDGVDQAWAELAQKRFTELVSGKTSPVSWEKIKKDVKG